MPNIKILRSASELPSEWDALTKDDLFLQSQYLKALELAAPKNIKLYYLLVRKDGELCGIALIQHVKLYLHDIFRKNTGNGLVRGFRRAISSVMKGHFLVVGNLSHTGQHGLFYQPENILNSEIIELLFKGLQEVSNLIKSEENKNIRLYLLKDYFSLKPLIKDETILSDKSLYKVKVQPNMVFNLKPSWNSIEDYHVELNKKYKRRYRTARKKLGRIIEVELSEAEIEERSKELHQLYRNVSDNAKLNMFVLPEDHFFILKRDLREKFKVFGFFLEDKLVGFYSIILNNSTLETYFLGYDPEHQYENQMYLNMLYNMLSFGIENNFKEIVYARTAMEIKSSVGAQPKEMLMYIKHTNSFLNRMLKPIFNLLDPTEEWQERHPFD